MIKIPAAFSWYFYNYSFILLRILNFYCSKLKPFQIWQVNQETFILNYLDTALMIFFSNSESVLATTGDKNSEKKIQNFLNTSARVRRYHNLVLISSWLASSIGDLRVCHNW